MSRSARCGSSSRERVDADRYAAARRTLGARSPSRQTGQSALGESAASVHGAACVHDPASRGHEADWFPLLIPSSSAAAIVRLGELCHRSGPTRFLLAGRPAEHGRHPKPPACRHSSPRSNRDERRGQTRARRTAPPILRHASSRRRKTPACGIRVAIVGPDPMTGLQSLPSMPLWQGMRLEHLQWRYNRNRKRRPGLIDAFRIGARRSCIVNLAIFAHASRISEKPVPGLGCSSRIGPVPVRYAKGGLI